MSLSTGVGERRQRGHSPQIEAVRREIDGRSHVGDPQRAREFASIFLRRAPEAFLRSRSVSELTNVTLAVLDFVERSRPDHVDVSVVNPSIENEGWEAPVTVVRASVSERPFVVDTIREFLHDEGLAIEFMVYPLLDVERDESGKVLSVSAPGDQGAKEALVHCEIERVADPATLAHIELEITRCLEDVVRATDDFHPMIAAVDAVVEELSDQTKVGGRGDDLAEIQAFLRWLQDGGFVFLGYRAYEVREAGGEKSIGVVEGSGLGLLRNEADSGFSAPVPLAELSAPQRELAQGGPELIISKTNAESTVHRRARMDYVGVRRTDGAGRTVGEHRFLGLFTSKAYSDAAQNIPILRHKLDSVLADAGVREGTHDYKAIITIFNSLPREELFVSSAGEIAADVRTVLTSYSTDDVKVSLREDPLHRGLSVMVIVPKDRFSGDVRRDIETALVDAFEGDVLNYHLALGEGDQARLHFYIATAEENIQRVAASDLEVTVGRLIRTWTDLVEERLEESRPPADAHRLAREYGDRLSPEYQAATSPEVAATDISELELMVSGDRTISVVLANRDRADQVAGVEGATQLKLFLRGERLVLSDFMPILDNLGLRVIAMQPYDVRRNGSPDATIYVFAVFDREGQQLDVDGRGELLSQTLLAARAGDAISDPLNALVLAAGLHWREVDVLRGLAAYAFQVGAVPSRSALPSALTSYPGLARELFELFQTRFDPHAWESAEQRLEAADDVRTAFQASLRGVSVLADDRALRSLEGLISATLRTNYYRCGGRAPRVRSGGVPYTSYKILVGDIEISRPAELLFEVWVYSSRMEGIHLRGATVARGGIRWSDRPDDFRTEVLGLVKTQMIKNAVIVPGGSKGGFITRRVPTDPDERFAEGREQYQTLMRGLLDLTDNLEAGRSVPPSGVVSYDPPDPYLVVAADKGTATFSDLANSVAGEYGFWLADAFASGGSHGYDHKAVGITARGGWECVKRHFREKGKDIQAEPFTVAGIGDMSGDVFGNGMLLSEQIRLVAAFDHRHIFIDPDPDPATSFAERKRMFGLGRSSWDDYDRDLLSDGGMIVSRGAKEVELTEPARRVLGLSDEEARSLNGESLIRCVLRAPVELLWNGGIGTYVKADSEAHAEAGNPTNDAVRIDVSGLRCEVVGEGGNLGFTQRARVEYALGGGRINTDALDNSGGVDMSDHEVNLKILMAPAVAEGDMTESRRNEVLEDLTESVAEHVLQNNRSQSLAISLDERRVSESADDFRDFMFALEKGGDLDRISEGLPSRDVLAERSEVGQSMVRPELCVLLAYAKLGLKTELLKSGLPDDPVAESYLVGYFPPSALVAVGQSRLSAHPLRREIVACQLTNDLVDLMGATFVYRLRRDAGCSAEQVVRAWLVASRLADHRALLRQMAEQTSVLNARVVTRWLLGLGRVLERATRWVLTNVKPDVSPATIVASNLEGLATLREAFGAVVAGEERDLFEARVKEIRDLGADEVFSTRLITLRFLDQLLEILEIARETETDVLATARAYYQVSELFDIPWLRRRTFSAAGEGQWEHRASQALAQDLSRAHRKCVVGVVCDGDEAGDYVAKVSPRDVERFRGILAELREEESVGLAAVSVAARELSAVADGLGRGTDVERRR
ncbi:MAG: NAD-glutamate dehydrogenase [Gemmatimonadota bacterium]|nr:NAD-glutamate dehydrogenase [Gemmatimonadota bacterium]